MKAPPGIRRMPVAAWRICRFIRRALLLSAPQNAARPARRQAGPRRRDSRLLSAAPSGRLWVPDLDEKHHTHGPGELYDLREDLLGIRHRARTGRHRVPGLKRRGSCAASPGPSRRWQQGRDSARWARPDLSTAKSGGSVERTQPRQSPGDGIKRTANRPPALCVAPGQQPLRSPGSPRSARWSG